MVAQFALGRVSVHFGQSPHQYFVTKCALSTALRIINYNILNGLGSTDGGFKVDMILRQTQKSEAA
jgi:hypothetical protein